MKFKVIIGGGLAGITAAHWAARMAPQARVVVLEKEQEPLSWLASRTGEPFLAGKIPGGAAWLDSAYPGGRPGVDRILEKWGGDSTRGWLEATGLEVRADESGGFWCRDGQTLRKQLLRSLEPLGVDIRTGFAVETISGTTGEGFRLWSKDGHSFEGSAVLIATGGERNHGLKLASELGLSVTPPQPAFLRLRLASPKAGDRLGPAVMEVGLRCPRSGESACGTVRISGRGLEGPALSRISARLHKEWKQLDYRVQLEVDWLPGLKGSAIRNALSTRVDQGGRRLVGEDPLFGLTVRQWEYFLQAARIDSELPWPRIKAKRVQALTQRLKGDLVSFSGMGLPFDERAWSGGVELEGLDYNTCRAQGVPNLFLAGEILDFLGDPGGPQLNAIWASGYLAGISLAQCSPA